MYKPPTGRALCCGELGCALSHLKIYEGIVKNKYKSVLFFEIVL
ncbi:MAG: glycosyltransferase family 25 protein [Holosporaceae bacterium]|nr:glycosyltransferase family 25 protein [Holosporaceae bacterium]